MDRVEPKSSGIPTFAYYAYAGRNRLCLMMRFESIFSARKGTRAVMKRLIGHGIGHKVSYHAPEPNRGEFEVELMFCSGIEAETVSKALETPPSSNRGVTKNV